MSATKSLISVNIAALFVEGLLYGVFALFFSIILSIALGPKHGRFMNTTRILQISGLMFLLATVHLILNLTHIFVTITQSQGFVDLATLFVDLQNPITVGKTFISLVQGMLGDAVLVWRCYVLHSKKIWVLLPGLTALMADTGVLVMYRIFIAWGIGPHGGWTVIMPALSILIHTSYTGVIVWRFWRAASPQNIHTTRSLTPVVAALIESGAMYSVTAVILLVCITVNSMGLFIVMDALPPLVGVLFCLVILQIHVYYVKDREFAPSGVSGNWSIPWRRGQRDEVSDV